VCLSFQLLEAILYIPHVPVPQCQRQSLLGPLMDILERWDFIMPIHTCISLAAPTASTTHGAFAIASNLAFSTLRTRELDFATLRGSLVRV
jgi:hypothetical protein